MSFLESNAYKAADPLLILVFLFSFAYLALAANVTVDSNVSKNQSFNVGTDCVIDNFSGNKYCFMKRSVSEFLTCPGFGVSSKFNYSDDGLGIFVQFNSSLCTPIIQTVTLEKNNTVPLDVSKKLEFGECFIHAGSNVSVCAPDLNFPPQIVILKSGELLNDTRCNLVAIVDNQSFSCPTASVTPSPTPVAVCGDGICASNELGVCPRDCSSFNPSNGTTVIVQAPLEEKKSGDNLLVMLGLVAVFGGGLYWYVNKRAKQEGQLGVG